MSSSRESLENARYSHNLSGDLRGLAWTYWATGNHFRQSSNYLLADENLKLALDLAKQARDSRCYVYALAGIAENSRIRGEYSIALAQHYRALGWFRRLEDARGVVWALEGIAQMYKNKGNYGIASRLFRYSASLARMSGDLRGLGYALKGLGESTFLAGDPGGLSLVSEAACHFRAMGFAAGALFAEKTLADLVSAKNVELASELYAQAAAGFARIQYFRGAAYAHVGLARTLIQLQRQEEAEILLINAQRFFRDQRIQYGMSQARGLVNVVR